MRNCAQNQSSVDFWRKCGLVDPLKVLAMSQARTLRLRLIVNASIFAVCLLALAVIHLVK